MHAKDLGCNNGCNGEAVEDVYKCLPDLDATPSLAFVVKSVYYELN